MGQEDFKPHNKNVRAVDEEKERRDGSVHNENLYDEGQDKYGNVIDPATGKLINETPATTGADEELAEVELAPDAVGEDALPPLLEEDDAAARWLRAEEKRLADEAKKGKAA